MMFSLLGDSCYLWPFSGAACSGTLPYGVDYTTEQRREILGFWFLKSEILAKKKNVMFEQKMKSKLAKVNFPAPLLR